MKKFISTIICIVICLTCFGAVGCGGNDDTSIKQNMTQLYVGNCSNGYGTEWLNAISAVFEEKYKNVSFEDGKIGVQIVPDSSGVSYMGGTYLGNIKSSRREVIFAEEAFYYDYASSNVLANITELINNPLTEFGETRSIKDKLDFQWIDYLEYNGKFYALPWWSGIQGVIYDADLFKNKSLYLAKNGAPSEALQSGGSFTNYRWTQTDDKSAGPDGKYNTYDDGLPATYTEFFKMCDHMVEIGITPFTWTGQYRGYVDMMIKYLINDYNGLNNIRADYDFSGKAANIIDTTKPIT